MFCIQRSLIMLLSFFPEQMNHRCQSLARQVRSPTPTTLLHTKQLFLQHRPVNHMNHKQCPFTEAKQYPCHSVPPCLISLELKSAARSGRGKSWIVRSPCNAETPSRIWHQRYAKFLCLLSDLTRLKSQPIQQKWMMSQVSTKPAPQHGIRGHSSAGHLPPGLSQENFPPPVIIKDSLTLVSEEG